MEFLARLLPGLGGTESIHPLFVHFPLGLLLTALALQVPAFARPRGPWAGHARVCLYLGTLGAVAALVTGLREAGRLGHDSTGHGLVHAHRNMMVVATLLGIGTSALALWTRGRTPMGNRAVLVGLLLTSIPLTLGADRGGELVFRYGIGVANAPVPVAEHGGHDHGTHAHDAALDVSVEPDAHSPAPAHGDNNHAH